VNDKYFIFLYSFVVHLGITFKAMYRKYFDNALALSCKEVGAKLSTLKNSLEWIDNIGNDMKITGEVL
jgi:hypothetical protein